MVDILVRNVDQATAALLKKRAKAEGKSFNDIAREALRGWVKPGKAELIEEFRRVRTMSPYSDIDSTALIREARDSR